MQSLAAPYQQQGAALQAQAQRGELTPAGQQSLQAAQAQAAQAAQARGGVGATQIQAQVEALRQQLLHSNTTLASSYLALATILLWVLLRLVCKLTNM